MPMPAAAAAFCLRGVPAQCKPYGGGHINETYLIVTDRGERYILQRINHRVFLDPPALMENAAAVTAHIRQKGGCAIGFLPDARGRVCHRDENGNFWRAYGFIPGFCLDTPRGPEDLYSSALAFGRFQQQLLDFPAQSLHITIPDFHNTPHRYGQLRRALDADPLRRRESCLPELEFALGREALGGRLQAQLEAGELPLRVTHNDTKLGNVLLDEGTGGPLCVLDLDTVMPGLAAYDFGDAIRSGAGTAPEDCPDDASMTLDLERFAAFARGFLEAAPSLTPAEKDSLVLGSVTMTLECGVRFLTDYINGDTYFRTRYPTHNLVRCRTQFALCRAMLARWDQMDAIIREAAL